MSEIFDLSCELDQQKRSPERIQLLTPEDGLTREQKNHIEKHYDDIGVKFSFRHQLDVIKVYDRGYIFPYQCTVNGKQSAVMFASVYKNGDLRIEEKTVFSETWYNDLMKKDTYTIQRTAIKLFPNLYCGVR